MSDGVWSGPDWRIECGDCLELLKALPSGSVDAVVTDPPYGCGKAEWDTLFPKEWYPLARRVACAVVIITVSIGLKDTMALVGNDVVDVIAARNMNALTRGPIGFSNWLAAVYVGEKPRQGPNAFDFVISGDMPDHPSPKPIEYMRKLILRVSEEGDTILDPFMGSATTGVACLQTSRKFIGFELDRKYCEIGARRLADVAPLFRPQVERKQGAGLFAREEA